MKTLRDIQSILENISFKDRAFHVTPKGDGFLVQLSYYEADVETGNVELQKSRKHHVSPWMTETEIVDTAFYMVMRSQEHVTREHFTYYGQRVRSPHFHIEARLEMCDRHEFDQRPSSSSSDSSSASPK